jgi:hypothetical protein
MPDRIVVCLSEVASRNPSMGAEGFLANARDLMLRAKAFGATLCTWSWGALSFSFQVDDLEEAVGFVTGPDARKLTSRFGVGISQGSLELLSGDGEIELGWGPVLQKAMLLSQLAKPGEVLVDCDLLAVHHVQLVTRGTRTSQGTPPLRAYLIAVDDPFRAEAERTVEHLVEPPLVGQDALLDKLEVSPGTLATVRARAGFGGTRLLRALESREKQSICLFLQPISHRMEPLGALRRALLRAQALGKAPELTKEHDATWRSVAEGHGADPGAVADLLEAWLAGGSTGSGLLLIDDANEIDSATLEVVAAALLGAEYPFRAVARLDHDSPLPAELAPLPPGTEVELAPLGDVDARKLVMAWTGGVMKDEEADVWAARGGGVPLALGEALAEALSSGELRWGEQGARPRSIPPQSPSAMTAASFVIKRMRFLTPGSRSVLHALATLGGDAPTIRIASLLESAADIPIDLDLELDRLTKAGWLRVPEPGWLALPSRTHLRIIEQSVPDTRRAAWHRVAASGAEAAGSLVLAEAAWHAVAANDRASAQRLANRAAVVAEAAGLESASRDLRAFARAHDPSPQPRIESDASGLVPRPPMASSPGDPEDIFPVALAARGPKRPSRFTFPPVEVPEGELLSEPPSFQAGEADSEPPSLQDSDLLPPSSQATTKEDAAPSAEVLGPEDVRRSIPELDAQEVIPSPPRVPSLGKRPAPVRKPTPPGTVRRPTLELLIDEEEGAPPSKAKPPERTSRPPTASSPPHRAVPKVPRPGGRPRPVTLPIDDVPPPPPSILEVPASSAEDEPPTMRQPREALGSIHELTEDDAIELVKPALPRFTPPDVDASAISSPNALSGSGELPDRAARFAIPIDEEPESERTLVTGEPELPDTHEETHEVEQPDESVETDETVADETDETDDAANLLLQVMRTGDAEEIQAWAEQTMTEAPERRRIVERVGALVELRRGKQADAVRTLRNACEQARNWPAIERARSHLAYALGLAGTGRSLEALVEGLEALARAREAGDSRAEQACLSFLRKLYSDQGRGSVDAWRPRSP